jgi:hypothetical protein
MGLSALLGLVGNLIGVGPLVAVVVRRLAARYRRTHMPNGPTGCNAFTIELRVEGPFRVAILTATADVAAEQPARTEQRRRKVQPWPVGEPGDPACLACGMPARKRRVSTF